MIEGSSQWVLGRNVTRPYDIIHIGAHEIRFPSNDALPMIDYNRLSYIPMCTVLCASKESPTISTLAGFNAEIEESTLGSQNLNRPWNEIKRIVDKVHKHVCGHSPFSDMRLLLQRNGIWNNAIQHYLSTTVSKCKDCIASSVPPPARKVSLATLSRRFNEVVAVDHFYLDSIRVLHFMDTVSRYSACYICKTANMEEAILGMQTCWLNQFWPPEQIHGDQAFNTRSFRNFSSHLKFHFAQFHRDDTQKIHSSQNTE